jgi:hypothetical protein
MFLGTEMILYSFWFYITCNTKLLMRHIQHAGYVVLTAVVMKSNIFWDIRVEQIRSMKNNLRFGSV